MQTTPVPAGTLNPDRRSRSRIALLVTSIGCLLNFGAVAGQDSFPQVSKLPTHPGLPDPLVMLNGQRVQTTNQWNEERRPELRALFEHYMYGPIPASLAQLQPRLLGQYPDFLDGKATLKLITLETGSSQRGGPRIDLLLIVPNQRRVPAPVFLAMNF